MQLLEHKALDNMQKILGFDKIYNKKVMFL